MALSRAEKDAGYKAVPQPSPRMTEILRRVAAGCLLATQTENGTIYTYDDGTPVRYGKHMLSDSNVKSAVTHGWLIPIKGESMFDGPPQRYRARMVEDGPLPRFISPR